MQKEVIWGYSFLLYKLKVIYFSVFAASCLQVYNPFSQQMYAYDNKKMVQCYFGNRNIAYGSKFCLSLENGRIFVTRKTEGIYCRFWYDRWAGVCFYVQVVTLIISGEISCLAGIIYLVRKWDLCIIMYGYALVLS